MKLLLDTACVSTNLKALPSQTPPPPPTCARFCDVPRALCRAACTLSDWARSMQAASCALPGASESDIVARAHRSAARGHTQTHAHTAVSTPAALHSLARNRSPCTVCHSAGMESGGRKASSSTDHAAAAVAAKSCGSDPVPTARDAIAAATPSGASSYATGTAPSVSIPCTGLSGTAGSDVQMGAWYEDPGCAAAAVRARPLLDAAQC